MFGLGAPELIIILLVVLVIFGGTQIPKLARSLGQAQKEFKTGLEEGAKDDGKDGEKGQKAPAPPCRSRPLGNLTPGTVVLDDDRRCPHVGGGCPRPRAVPLQ